MNYKFLVITFLVSLTILACNSEKEDKKPELTDARMPNNILRADSALADIPLDALLKPTNAYVISSIPITTIDTRTEEVEVPALGTVQYDYRQAGVVSARIAGRIEKLYVRYRFQKVSKGQKILEIYSPELLTSQQNLIFLAQNDPTNTSLISAARQRLLLLGMTNQQVNHILNTGKPIYSVSVYSNYSGFIIDAGTSNMLSGGMVDGMQPREIEQTTEELSIKEGMYLDEGQPIFTIINTSTSLVSLNVFAEQQGLIKVGNPVVIRAETYPDAIRSRVAYIEPFYEGETRTLSARAYINNTNTKIPIGGQVQATIFTGAKNAAWLPASAVISLGINDVVFLKEGPLFRAKKVTTGIKQTDQIQILSGLSPSDSVAINAQYLTESESFIQVKE